LKAGIKPVTLTIDPRLLADWKDGLWTTPKGAYGFALGQNAEVLGEKVSITLPAKSWKE
jgi:beta-glucosidase